tara:strand:+ start:492 stop:674 length:183 start_codon:yes stop_codon:yes gene_type:complete
MKKIYIIMKKIIIVLILGILFASCGSSRGCKKMRKYRKYTHQTIETNTNQINTNQINYLS